MEIPFQTNQSNSQDKLALCFNSMALAIVTSWASVAHWFKYAEMTQISRSLPDFQTKHVFLHFFSLFGSWSCKPKSSFSLWLYIITFLSNDIVSNCTRLFSNHLVFHMDKQISHNSLLIPEHTSSHFVWIQDLLEDIWKKSYTVTFIQSWFVTRNWKSVCFTAGQKILKCLTPKNSWKSNK